MIVLSHQHTSGVGSAGWDLHNVLFEACSALFRVTAFTLASPYIVICKSETSAASLPP